MALTRPSKTVQQTSGVGVLAYVCGQKADTSSSYCDNVNVNVNHQFIQRITANASNDYSAV